MRVTKSQLVHGVTAYVQNEILPKLGNRALQILISVGANTAAANGQVMELLFGNQIVRAILDDDGSGTVEIGGLADAMRKSIDQYGSFPVQVPVIPLICPEGFTISLAANDVTALFNSVENAV